MKDEPDNDDLPPPDEEDGEVGPEEPLVTVCTYNTSMEAHFARMTLENAGIPCVILDEGINAWYPHLTTAVGGIRLQVLETDAEAAARELDVPAAGEEIRDEVVSARPSQCPKCSSEDIKRYWGPALFNIAFWLLTAASFITNRSWQCNNCGHEWKE
jgi:hypothetical protein